MVNYKYLEKHKRLYIQGDGAVSAKSLNNYREDVELIIIEGHIGVVPHLTPGLFRNMPNLRQIYGTLDIAGAGDLSFFCAGCTSLIVGPILDTSRVREFSMMFFNCKSLKFTPTYDLIDATTTIGMFKGCESLSENGLINLPKRCSVVDMYKDSGLSYLQEYLKDR